MKATNNERHTIVYGKKNSGKRGRPGRRWRKKGLCGVTIANNLSFEWEGHSMK